MLVLVTYDIMNSKRRRKIGKLLEDYGARQQLSVFECILDNNKLADLIRDIKALMKPREDRVQIYHLCEACRLRSDHYCQGGLMAEAEVFIC